MNSRYKIKSLENKIEKLENDIWSLETYTERTIEEMNKLREKFSSLQDFLEIEVTDEKVNKIIKGGKKK